MRTMNQMQALENLPNDCMAKKIILKILNTPKPDYDAMKNQAKKYEEELIAEMSVRERKKLAKINSEL